MEQALATLLSPMVLFFMLGLVAALLRSQMSVPEAFAKGLALYLMMAIGLKGGVEMSKSAFSVDILLAFLAGIILSAALPIIAYVFLRVSTKLTPVDAAATSAHYGSISIVTFVASSEFVRASGFDISGHMVAIAAVMETPAIITALLLAQRGGQKNSSVAGSEQGELVREVLLNASVVVLIGALMIGWVVGEAGFERVAPFFVDPFQGVLCLFLLDMGLSAGRGLRQGWRQLGFSAVAFGIYMPLVSAAVAGALAFGAGMSVGDTALLITLAASASYIAVPAAMRLALPKAQPSIYLTLSLGVTFPFNLTVGIPLYIAAATMIAGAS